MIAPTYSCQILDKPLKEQTNKGDEPGNEG